MCLHFAARRDRGEAAAVRIQIVNFDQGDPVLGFGSGEDDGVVATFERGSDDGFPADRAGRTGIRPLWIPRPAGTDKRPGRVM